MSLQSNNGHSLLSNRIRSRPRPLCTLATLAVKLCVLPKTFLCILYFVWNFLSKKPLGSLKLASLTVLTNDKKKLHLSILYNLVLWPVVQSFNRAHNRNSHHFLKCKYLFWRKKISRIQINFFKNFFRYQIMKEKKIL